MKKVNISRKLFLFLPVILFGGFYHATAQDEITNPLQPFEKVIGEWVLDNFIQTFEWGPGKRSVIATSYSVNDTTKAKVSEGMWFWHPGQEEIKGYFSAVNMPFTFLEYTTSFEGGKMISQLLAFDSNGNESRYQEIIEMRPDSAFDWELWQISKQDTVKIMEDIFSRKRN